MSHLEAAPLTQKQSDAFILRLHRHHEPAQGDVFRIAAALNGEIVGVVVVGRPVSYHLQDGWTAEVTRLCTDGTKNACSFLYSRAARVARELGWRRIVTYTLPEEGGASLVAAGWELVDDEAGGGSWNSPSRPRVDKHPTDKKWRWQKILAPASKHPRPTVTVGDCDDNLPLGLEAA